MPLLGGVIAHVGGLDVPPDRVPLLGAMARLWAEGGHDTLLRVVFAHVGGLDTWCRCWVPLLGAMVRCHCSVPLDRVPLVGCG